MRGVSLLALALVTAAIVPLGPAASHSGSDRFDIQHNVTGDAYVLSITLADPVELTGGSELTVQASYTGQSVDKEGAYIATQDPRTLVRPDATFQEDAPREHGSALVAFLEETNLGTEEATGDSDTDFQRGFGVSVDDLSGARLAVRDPVHQIVHRDPQQAGLNGLQIDLAWNADSYELPGPASSNEVTYHLLVSVPGAQWIDVDGHLHLSPSANVTSTSHHIGNEGGFMYVGEDFGYDQRIETAGASLARSGTVAHDFQQTDGDEHLYAHLGPSETGSTATRTLLFGGSTLLAATTPNLSFGDYQITDPDGATHRVPDCVGVVGESVRCPQFSIGASNGPRIVGSTLEGTYTFEVDRHFSVPAGDMVATGYEGPLE